VAIVGSRAATAAGRARAAALAGDLARRGFDVISGGAFGIDAQAHEGALAAGAQAGAGAGAGATYAVLGCGTDVVYPDRHGPLFDRIARSGGLLSEHPPGTPARVGNFPARNRIIAALAEAVVVVEAAPRSGALITARLAGHIGVPLLASPGSPGTDGLLEDGRAGLCEEAADVERALAGSPRRASGPAAPSGAGRWAPLLAALGRGGSEAADVARRLGRPLRDVLADLAAAELEGWVRRRPGNLFEVVRGG
jgi:DNA processing protein